MRETEPEISEWSLFEDLISSDDVTLGFADLGATKIPRIYCRNAALICQGLIQLAPALSFPKSLHFVVAPALISGRACRWAPDPHRQSNVERRLLGH